jgi:hypothetical protein
VLSDMVVHADGLHRVVGAGEEVKALPGISSDS